MSQSLIIEVPEALAHSARAVAARTGRRVEDVLAAWLTSTALGPAIMLAANVESCAAIDTSREESNRFANP